MVKVFAIVSPETNVLSLSSANNEVILGELRQIK